MMPQRWFVLSALVPPRGEEFLMVDALRRLGARAIEREGERVVAWLPAPDDVDALLRDARSVLRASTSLDDPALACGWRSQGNWVERWVRGVGPRRVTDRIVVAPIGHEPGHDAEPAAEQAAGDVVIRLEAGIAFGTAEHATTRGCLRLLERVLRNGDRAIDIGTGSGVLAIAAALLGARDVLAFESDPPSCDSARRNVAANDVADVVSVHQLVVTVADLPRIPARDVILANLEAGIIRGLLPALHDALAPRGALIASGITAGELASLLGAAAVAGLDVRERENVDGWTSVVFSRSAAS
jgi:ribosomal protein L11 methyltransferase